MTELDPFIQAAFDGLDAALAGAPNAVEAKLDPNIVFIGSGEGEEAVGHDALRAMLQWLSEKASGGTFEIDWESAAHEVIGDIAVIHAFGTVRAAGSMARFDGTRYRMTGTLRRRDGAWRWVAYHGSEPGAWE
ncbi:MAG TPA: nuclear transport factor 2 family protein [Gaiellales bacterium]|nr:nuclear transport factor 2 family protein [Gaiellales bacterium]